MREKEIAQKAYTMYMELRRAGFIEPQVLSLISNFISNLAHQLFLREESDLKAIRTEEK